MKIDNKYLKYLGQYLHMTQELKDNEYSWSLTKIDLPESWKIIGITKENNQVIITNTVKEKYFIDWSNLNKLSSGLMGTKRIPDETIIKAWKKHATLNPTKE